MQRIRLIYLDTETTGLKEPSGVCEIAFIELDLDTFEELGRYHSLIDPEMPISHTASGIHHITDDMVQDSPTLEQYFEIVLGNMFDDTDMVVLAAHNAVFDAPFVAPYLPENLKTLCTLKLAKRAYPDAEDFKLSTFKYAFKLGKGASHNALADVVTGVGLLRKIARDLEMGLDELLPYQDSPRILKVMPFGKHKDQPIAEVDAGYVRWYLRQDSHDPDVLSTFRHHFPRLFKD